MPFIIGTPIPEDKILVQSVSQIYGIGLSQSKILCRKAGFGQDCRGKNVSFSQGKILGNLAENTSLFLGSDLRRFRNDKIRRLCLMSSYRGLRQKKGLPVRGQRTHTNAKICFGEYTKKHPLPWSLNLQIEKFGC